jgi:hypothetical protein
MDRSILRNDILTKGAILGGVMLTSRVIETSMISYGGNIGWMLFLLLEWIVMAVVYVILINSFTRGYARKQLASQQGFQHFSYGNGLSYAILISMLAGIIVAIGGYIFLHGIVGYDNYIDANINLVVGVFKDAKMEVPQNVQEMIKEMKAIPEPSIINTLISSVWSYLLSGAIIGSIVAIFTRRKPQIVKKNEEQEKQDEQ